MRVRGSTLAGMSGNGRNSFDLCIRTTDQEFNRPCRSSIDFKFVRCSFLPALCLGLMANPEAIIRTAAAKESDVKRTEDVIYGRKFGTALTMDVFQPAKPNGAAVIFCVSGGWFSAHDLINTGFAAELLKRGYTVFAVVHGSQPKFTIPEVLQDMHRAVRYIRSHATDYGIDPDRIGISGASAGGHLSLMQGTAGTPGDPEAKDPVDRESSRVQAVGCFFPPTDFLNYGQPGENAIGTRRAEEISAHRLISKNLTRRRNTSCRSRTRSRSGGDRQRDFARNSRHGR